MSKAPVISCCFRQSGFDGFIPCGTRYHVKCIKAGPPFHSRRKDNLGLAFPASIKSWGNFICEACTVRSITQREIETKNDSYLLQLERMRLIDMSWYWSQGTHASYQSKLRIIHKFEESYGLCLLPAPVLTRPPDSPDIPLMWCMEVQSTRKTTHKSRGAGVFDHISSITVRTIRTAASQYYQWEALVSHPSAAWLNKERRLLYQPCRPTDGVSMTMFNRGLLSRMGDVTTPSRALCERHVIAVDNHWNHVYKSTTCPVIRREAALGGLANILFWLE